MTAEEENLRNHLQQPGKLRDSLDSLIVSYHSGWQLPGQRTDRSLVSHTVICLVSSPARTHHKWTLSSISEQAEDQQERTECGASFIGLGEGKQF